MKKLGYLIVSDYRRDNFSIAHNLGEHLSVEARILGTSEVEFQEHDFNR